MSALIRRMRGPEKITDEQYRSHLIHLGNQDCDRANPIFSKSEPCCLKKSLGTYTNNELLGLGLVEPFAGETNSLYDDYVIGAAPALRFA